MEETRALLAQYNLAATVRSHGSPGTQPPVASTPAQVSQYGFMVVSLPVPLWEADKLRSSALQHLAQRPSPAPGPPRSGLDSPRGHRRPEGQHNV